MKIYPVQLKGFSAVLARTKSALAIQNQKKKEHNERVAMIGVLVRCAAKNFTVRA
jgi:hypothetical protein